MSIHAIICDLFDVLVFDDNIDEREAYERRLGLTAGAIKQGMLRSPCFKEALAGRIDETELWRDVASTLHLDSREGPTLAEKFYSAVRTNDELLAFVRLLHSQYKTAVLSNAPMTVRELVTRRLHLDNYVDEIILSAEVGIMKPEPAIYQLAAKRLGVAPHESLFIDDEERFTHGARAVGMQAIQFRDTKQVIMDLQRLLFVHTNRTE